MTKKKVTDNIHATGIKLGAHGILLRGEPGAGKSLMTLALFDSWEMRGATASLVSDDRVDLSVKNGALWMTAPERIAGLIELRGRGIVERKHVKTAKLHLVVDMVDKYERMVEEDALVTEIEGISVPRCPVPKAGVIDSLHQLLLIREAIRALRPARKPSRQKTT